MIVGRITADGAPVAGAVVTVRRGEVVADATTDARGGFDLAVPDGRYELIAGAAGYLPDYRGSVATGAPVELALQRGGRRVRGTVRDLEGRPIAGARVDARRVVAFTDVGGRYQFSHPPGLVVLAITHDAHAPKRREIAIVDDLDDVDVALERGVEIRGVVRMRDGRPVAGAAIQATGASTRALSLSRIATTDEDGAFVATGHAAGEIQVAAWTATQASRNRHEVFAMAGEAVTIELVVQPALAIRGRVVDRAGAPVENAPVRLELGRARFEYRFATSDADGRFEIHGLFAGAMSLDVWIGSAHAELDVQLVDRDLDVVLDLGELRSLCGRVEPASASDLVHGETTLGRAGSDGRFELRGIRTAARDLVAITPDGGCGEIEVVPGDEVVVPIGAGQAVRGEVVDEAGAPVVGAIVSALAKRCRRLAASDAVGQFCIVGMPSGDVWVELPSGREQIRVQPGELARLVQRREVGVLRGVVRDERGSAVEGARVLCSHDVAITGADGGFAFTGLAEGEHGVRAFGPRGDASAEVTTVLGEVPVLVLAPYTSVKGRVTSDGKPVTTFEIGDQHFDSPDGAFETHRLPAKNRTLIARSELGSAIVELDGERRWLDLEIPRAQVVRGRAVSVLDGTPLAGIDVRAYQLHTYRYTDADGRFEIPVPPGCELTFTDDDGNWFGGLVARAVDLGDVPLAPPAPTPRPGTIGAVGNPQDGALDEVGEPAASAGIVVGDRLVALDGVPIPPHLRAAVLGSSLAPGRAYELTFERGLVVTVTAVANPE